MKYVSWANPISCGANIVLMSEKTWNSLPQDVQLIMEGLNEKAKYQYLDAGQQQDIDSVKTLKDAGMDLYSLSPKELMRWKDLAEPVIEQWISNTDAAGYAGDEAYDTARQVVERFK